MSDSLTVNGIIQEELNRGKGKECELFEAPMDQLGNMHLLGVPGILMEDVSM